MDAEASGGIESDTGIIFFFSYDTMLEFINHH